LAKDAYIFSILRFTSSVPRVHNDLFGRLLDIIFHHCLLPNTIY